MKIKQHKINFQRHIKRLIFVASFFCLLFATATLFPISSSEQKAEAAFGNALSAYLDLTFKNTQRIASLDVTENELSSNFKNGVFKESSPIKFSVSTNSYFGYRLFLTADDDSGALSSGSQSIHSIPASVSGVSFAAANNTQYNNLWGWRFYNASIPGNDDYQYYNPSPTTEPVELYSTSNTTTYDYHLSFGTRINTETNPGVYTKNVNIVAIANPVTYIMFYEKNTTDNVVNLPSTQSGMSTEISIPISSLLPTRAGYAFMGWCTMPMNNDLCPGSILQPGDLYGLDQTIENAIFLYAVWTPTMQDYTYDQCEQNAADANVYLADLRDRKSYSARFINGNCFMTQNLAYDLKTNNTLSPETSNVDSVTTINAVGDLTSGNTYTEARIHIPTEEDLAETKLPAIVNGYWYNYCAATAGEICQSSTTEEATIDICPAGWKIPSDEEWNLIGGDGSYSTTHVEAFSPVATGTWDNSILYSSSADGNLWSTTAYDTTNRYSLNYYPSYGLESGAGYYRYYGVSVRCVLEKPTMQNYTNEKCAAEATDEAVTVVDERDGNEYTVRYINDSCWMTQNLSYDLATNNILSPETSNVSSVTTISTVGDLTSGDTYTEARIHIPTEEDLTKTKLTAEANGYWYNYCAATAGEICADSSMAEATIDICPAGWKIPSDKEWNLIGGDGSYSTTHVEAFSPVAAGLWTRSILLSPSSVGYWWSTTADDISHRYTLNYASGRLYSSDDDLYGRNAEFSVRCMLTK